MHFKRILSPATTETNHFHQLGSEMLFIHVLKKVTQFQPWNLWMRVQNFQLNITQGQLQQHQLPDRPFKSDSSVSSRTTSSRRTILGCISWESILMTRNVGRRNPSLASSVHTLRRTTIDSENKTKCGNYSELVASLET